MEIDELRLIQISAAYVGAQKQIEDGIYNKLHENGADSKVLYLVGESKNKDYIKCENKVENIARRFCYKYIKKSYVFSLIQTRRVIRIIESFNPSIVHLHSIHHGYIHFPMLFDYLRRKRIKIVYTVHDMWPFTGGCYHYTDIQCTGFINGCNNCRNNLEQHDCDPQRAAELYELKKECYRGQDITFVTVSNWVKEEVSKSFIKSYPCYVIHNGIDSQEKDTVTRVTIDKAIVDSIKKHKSIVFVAASWNKNKGYDTICDVSKLLGEEYCVVLVGNISDDLKKRATSNMLFTGYLKCKSDLRLIYRLCNLHASASKEETFGMTFVEAAFEGTRSVGFACTAVEETISGVGGICVYERNANGLYNAICEHINDPKLSYEEIETIRNCYSNSVMADKYLEVYKDCLE